MFFHIKKTDIYIALYISFKNNSILIFCPHTVILVAQAQVELQKNAPDRKSGAQ